MDDHCLEVLEFHRIRELVAERCLSESGRRVARDLRPSVDETRIRVALGQTDEMRALLDSHEEPPLAGMGDARRVVLGARDERRPLEPGELWLLRGTLRCAGELKVFLLRDPEKCPNLAELSRSFLDHSELVEALDATIEAPGDVRDNASEKLWELKKSIRETEEEVREHLDKLLRNPRITAALQSRTFTVRNGRFVVPVKVDMKGRVPGILHDQSQSGATVFIEPSELVPESNRLRELRLELTKEENRILWELTRTVLAVKKDLVHTADMLAWFDFTLGKARLSRDFDMRSPEPSPDGRLLMMAARHPLLEAAGGGGGTVVPLDFRLRDGFSILVITGPNTGGKTVTLKTVGLLQIMFQSGLHVPVGAGSVLPVFEEIKADIGDEQSIDQSLSTFSGHIRNVAEILRVAGPTSLVLLDELGAGTDPAEGAALGRAILERLRKRNAACIVTTHLGSLKEFAFVHPEVENACVEFDAETMAPTYRLLIGQPGNSNALSIARRYGLDDEILEEAAGYVQRDDGSGEIVDQLVESRVALEKTRRESDQHLQESRDIEEAAAERMRHVEKRQRRLDREAEDLVDQALATVRDEAAIHLRELSNVPTSHRSAVESLGRILDESVRSTSIAKKRRELIKGLKKDDSIFVPKFGRLCRIRKFHRADEKLTVIVGRVPMEIGYDDVSWIEPLPDGDED